MGQSWWQLDWVWTTTGWALGVVGGALLLWALFADRSRGRRRCPKCWYDMAGVPGRPLNGRVAFQCPECGRVARSERRLQATRRRWWFVMAALPVFVLAHTAAKLPEYRRGGWVRLVPSTYLAFAASTEFPPPSNSPMMSMAGTRIVKGRVVAPGMMGPSNIPAQQALGEETWRRIHDGKMWGWQAGWFVGRCVEPLRAEWEPDILVPARWSCGAKVPALVDSSRTISRWELAMTDADGTCSSLSHTARIERLPATGGVGERARLRVWFSTARGAVYSTTMVSSCRLVANPLDIMRANSTPEASETARRLLDPRISIVPRGPVTVAIDERTNSQRWRGVRMGLGCRVEVLMEGELIGSAAYAPSWSRELFKNWNELPIRWKEGVADRIRAHPELLRFRVTGDPQQSLIALGEWPFDDRDPECWTGSFEIAAPIVLRPEKFEER